MEKPASVGSSSNKHPYAPSPWIANPKTRAPDSTTLATEASVPSPATISSDPLASSAAAGPQTSAAFSTDGSYDPSAAAAGNSSYSNGWSFLPFLFPQQSDIYHAQLLHYNRLISPSRGGGGLQSPALPPVVSAPHVNAAPRSRSSSKVSLKDSPVIKGNQAGGHGSRSHQNPDKNRPVITAKEAPPKMPAKQQNAEPARSHPIQRQAQPSASTSQSHSSSVPSTPQQRARQFSFESRDPSPSANNNHSPRSAYSETTSTLPSFRQLTPRLGVCRFETAQMGSRRRIPYSVGNDRLERLDLRTVKAKLTEDEEKKLATDTRELFDRILPTTRVEENRKKLVRKLEKIFNDEWPGHDITVHPFGSSGNLLCSDDSDVDICITTSWRELENVCMIADLLARRGMEKVVCISAAKVPIVKIWDPELKLACDMNVNNTLALENTRMIRTYVEIDPRVRQLGMIIKHWTRRRKVNDAAFGGTLSSYTWICMIIAFLQLRDPPVLPALHQLPYKIPKSDGHVSEFADNLKKLKGFGNKNKSSVADLLFQFFRFFAHEYDYQKHILSVRLGKLLSKTEKYWHHTTNNDLCIEEPFNITRNLGNTADEYSFHGLHLEMRRAFDLLSAANLEEACEQFIFPKEEEKVWSRPAPQPRPVLLRSASQTHSGRGGRGNHRGGRHNHNFHRGGGSNRRASSSVPTYDANMYMQPVAMQQDLAWYQAPAFQMPYVQQDLMAQIALQQENMRQLQLYAQSPAFMQHQQLSQNLGQQRGSSVAGSSGATSTSRSRTNSFDKGPLNATLRPDMYALYGMNLNPNFFQQTAYGTYPSSPVNATGPNQDFRRSLQRSTGTTSSSGAAPGSSLRSQSQPAARSPSAAQPNPANHILEGQSAAPLQAFPPRNVNGVAIPSFISDDVDFDETPKPITDSPLSDDGSRAGGFFAARSSSPSRQQQPTQALANGIAFGDLASQSSSPRRRRLSTDHMPQTVLDRRMRRQSRSPSPLGHARAFSTGTASAPLASSPFPAGKASQNPPRPLVVNGSGLRTTTTATTREAPTHVPIAPENTAPPTFENPLHIQGGSNAGAHAGEQLAKLQPAFRESARQSALEGPPVVVNGSGLPLGPPPGSDTSFRERIAMMDAQYMNSLSITQDTPHAASAHLAPAARQRMIARQPQNGVIAPLDLAIRDGRGDKTADPDLVHLSPVYETQTPSPTAVRGGENYWQPERHGSQQRDPKASRSDAQRTGPKPDDRAHGAQDSQKVQRGQKASPQQNSKAHAARDNGHVRGAKSETDGVWQKASKSKKRSGHTAGQMQGHAEQPPRDDSERKGG